jgi:hypothetical protein
LSHENFGNVTFGFSPDIVALMSAFFFTRFATAAFVFPFCSVFGAFVGLSSALVNLIAIAVSLPHQIATYW